MNTKKKRLALQGVSLFYDSVIFPERYFVTSIFN
jgi:hypothetical protein